MVDEQTIRTLRDAVVARPDRGMLREALNPRVLERIVEPAPRLAGPLPAVPPPAAPPAVPDVPAAPADDPFAALPFPSPGDRIKAEDFRRLSQALMLLRDAYVLSSRLCGQPFGVAKAALAIQQYRVERAISVFGTQLAHEGDATLDARTVLQVMPTAPGERRVTVLLSEAVETRRFMPNLVGQSYRAATEQLRIVIGDAAFAGLPMRMPDLVGRTVAEARQLLNQG